MFNKHGESGSGGFASLSAASQGVDSVEYTIFVVREEEAKGTSSTAQSTTAESSSVELDLISNTLSECMKVVEECCGVGYLWHYESFGLDIKKLRYADEEKGEGMGEGMEEEDGAHLCEIPSLGRQRLMTYVLRGRLRYGENIHDEWFVVHLLREITRRVPNTFAEVKDCADGNFLLIEAAEYLPEWLGDETTSRRRVFVAKGDLHVIPVCDQDEEEEGQDYHDCPCPSSSWLSKIFPASNCRPKLGTVARILFSPFYSRFTNLNPELGFANELVPLGKKIHESVWGRVKEAVEMGKRDVGGYEAVCFIPHVLGALLQRDGQMVSPLVHTFYSRDMVDMRKGEKLIFSGLPVMAHKRASGASGSTSVKSYGKGILNNFAVCRVSVTTEGANSAMKDGEPGKCVRIETDLASKGGEECNYGFYRVCFTKCLYAQLMAGPFRMPQKYALAAANCAKNVVSSETAKAKMDKILEQGCRLTFAFEMMMSSELSSIDSSATIETLSMTEAVGKGTVMSYRRANVNRILDLLCALSYPVKGLTASSLDEMGVEWMFPAENELKNQMEAHFQKPRDSAEGVEEDLQEDPEHIMKTVNMFMNNVSDFSGAEFASREPKLDDSYKETPDNDGRFGLNKEVMKQFCDWIGEIPDEDDDGDYSEEMDEQWEEMENEVGRGEDNRVDENFLRNILSSLESEEVNGPVSNMLRYLEV
eukprot:Nk52_evm86s745 gene=Nk52_evmTU86s745